MLDLNEVLKTLDESLKDSNCNDTNSIVLDDSIKGFLDSANFGITYFPHFVIQKEYNKYLENKAKNLTT